jgi:hypothetical protein
VDVHLLAIAEFAKGQKTPCKEQQVVVEAILPVRAPQTRQRLLHALLLLYHLLLHHELVLRMDYLEDYVHEASIKAALLALRETVTEHGEDEDAFGVRAKCDGVAVAVAVVQGRLQHADEVWMAVVLDYVLKNKCITSWL